MGKKAQDNANESRQESRQESRPESQGRLVTALLEKLDLDQLTPTITDALAQRIFARLDANAVANHIVEQQGDALIGALTKAVAAHVVER